MNLFFTPNDGIDPALPASDSRIYLNNGRCIESCEEHYLIDYNYRICLKCDSNCYSCEGNYKKCTKCYENMYLVSSTNLCVNICPSGEFGSQGLCVTECQ